MTSEQSLRDALEKAAAEHESGGGHVAGYVATVLRDVLAAHPVEPASERECLATRTLGITPHVCLLHPGHESDHQWTADREHPAEPAGVSDEERASGLIDCGGTGHEFEAEVADCRTCGSVGVSDEAVEAAFYALHEEFAVTSPPILRKAVRSVLEAAAPLMGATPVASPDAVTAVLTAHNLECTGPGEVTCRGCREKGWMSWPDYRRHITDALIAAGVFIEPPTREQALSAIGDTLNRRIEYIEDHATVQSAYEAATDAVLNLLGGAS